VSSESSWHKTQLALAEKDFSRNNCSSADVTSQEGQGTGVCPLSEVNDAPTHFDPVFDVLAIHGGHMLFKIHSRRPAQRFPTETQCVVFLATPDVRMETHIDGIIRSCS